MEGLNEAAQQVLEILKLPGYSKRERKEMAERYLQSVEAANATLTDPNFEGRQKEADFQFNNDTRATQSELSTYADYNDENRRSVEKMSPILLEHQKGQMDNYADTVGKITAPGYDFRNRQLDSRDANLLKLIEADNNNRKRQNTMDMLRTGGAILLNFL